MNADGFAPIEAIARALLYEGYLLFPYRAESLKNRIRTSFGELAPLGGPSYRRAQQTAEVPIVASGEALVFARVAFLQPVRRTLHDAEGRAVERIAEGTRTIVAWDEAREIVALRGPFRVDELAGAGIEVAVEAPAVDETAQVGCGTVHRVGAQLVASLHLSIREAGGGSILRCRLGNGTHAEAKSDDALVMHASHVALAIEGGAFASVVDPPAELDTVAAACEPDGAWFILAGSPDEARLALASPIILGDYPEIAPESPTDLFDATENDELLALCTRALGDGERRAAAATDPRAAALIELVGALDNQRFGALHGATRGFSTRDAEDRGAAARLRVGDEWVGAGDHVVLAPRGREALDAALAGRRARVVEVLVEVAGREHLVVVLDDDPGRDLGEMSRGLGHRFFVSTSEVVLDRAGAAP